MRNFIASVVCAGLLAAAVDPREEAFIGTRRNYWAFQKVERPAVPAVGGVWAKTPIDAFVLEGLQAKKLVPSGVASKRTLIRRVTMDLTGLPPAQGEVDAFLKDNSPNAYEKLVDRLIASPAYGERWALKWLDVVRYADTNGYELDAERPQAWRYRDYVIQSFNAGKPYDRFLKEQIAGDELYPGDHQALIATGFLRAAPRHVVGGNTDQEMNRQEVLLEMTLSVSNTFLGLTVGCARCHNHKFDPITQADHYRLQAVLASAKLDEPYIATKEERLRYDELAKKHAAREKPIKDAIAEIEKPTRARLQDAKKKLLTPAHRAVLEIGKDKRTPEQELLFKEAQKQIGLSWDEVVNALPADLKAKRAGLRRQLHELDYEEPEPPAMAFAVVNAETVPVTHILKIGDHRQARSGGAWIPVGAWRYRSTEDAAGPARCAGELDGRYEASADGACNGESDLAVPDGHRHRADAERFWAAWRAAVESEVARLAGGGVCVVGLEREGDGQVDCHLGGVQTVRGDRPGEGRHRQRQPVLLADEHAAAGRGSDSRRGAAGERAAQHKAVWRAGEDTARARDLRHHLHRRRAG